MTNEEHTNLQEGDVIFKSETAYDFTKDKEYIISLDKSKGLCIRKDTGELWAIKGLVISTWTLKLKPTQSWWNNVKPGDLIICHSEPKPRPDNCPAEPGGAGFKANKIFSLKSVVNYNFHGVLFNDNNLGVFSNSCSPIKIQLPKEGKFLMDDLDNWKFIQEHLICSGKTESNSGMKNPKYIVWGTQSFNYWREDRQSLPLVTLQDCIVYLDANTPTNSITINNKQLNSNQDGRKESIIKVERPVPTISNGTKPRGVSISGRTSKTSIRSRYIGDKASVIKC